MNLLDLIRAYPGGVAQLATDSGVPAHTLYRFAHKEHRRKPVRTIDLIAPAFRGKEILGQTYDAHALAKLWDETVAAQEAS